MTVVNKDAQAVGSMDWVRSQVDFMLNSGSGQYAYSYVRDVFPDRIIVSQDSYDGGGRMFEIPYTIDGSELILDVEAAVDVKVEYVAKSGSPVLTGPIVLKSNDERRLAYAAVLVPGEPDSDGDVVTAEKVEEVAHKWLEEYRNIDLMHTLSPANATVVESYVTPAEMSVGDYTLPQGTWVMGSKINDDDVWSAIKNGELTGYSIMGVRKAAFKSASISEAALKRTLLSDLGDDWLCPFVSIVDTPAVPKAKFFALKSEGAQPNEDGVMAKLAKALGFTPADRPEAIKVGRKFSDKTYTRMKDALSALSELLEEAEAERSTGDKAKKSEQPEGTKEGIDDMTPEELKAALGEAVAPLVERLDKLETAKTEPPAEEQPADEADKSADDPRDAEIAELKSQLEEQGKLLEEVNKRLGNIAPATKSRALRGQDTDGGQPEAAEKSEDDGRDVFGRSRKKRYDTR